MKLPLFLLTLLLPALLNAAVTLELSAKDISQDDSVSLTLRIDGPFGATIPVLPIPEGLIVRGTSRQQYILNGAQTTSMVFELQAMRPGEFQIGPYKLSLGGTTVELPALNLKVSPAKVIQSSEELFMTLESTVESPLVQQSVDIRLSLYSVNPIDNLELLEFPTGNYEIKNFQESASGTQNIQGRSYRVHRFTSRLTANSPGTLTLSPVFMVSVSEPGAMRRSPLGMLQRGFDVRRLRVQPKPLILEVLAPPAAGRPEGYQGHIGRYQLSATAAPDSVKVGDPVTLRIQLSGSGAIRQALPPSYPESDDFKVYAPRLIEEDVDREGLSGRKVLEQVLIPKHAKVTEIPLLRFSFYNPETRRYESQNVGPFPLRVEAAPGGTSAAALISSLPASAIAAEAKMLGEDLYYLKTDPGHLQLLAPGFPASTAAGLVPLAIWALFALVSAHNDKRNADPAERRRRQAPRRLRKQLEALEKLQNSAELHAAFWNCLSDQLCTRLRIPPGDIDTQRLLPHLPASLPDETRNSLFEWLNRCERARFAGTSETSDPAALRRDFAAFVLRLERELSS